MQHGSHKKTTYYYSSSRFLRHSFICMYIFICSYSRTLTRIEESSFCVSMRYKRKNVVMSSISYYYCVTH